MFKPEFFESQSWHKIIKAFSDKTGKNPVIEISTLDGDFFKVFKMQPWKSCLVLEIYIEPGKTSIKLLPYEQIKDINFLEHAAEEEQFDQREPIGFKTPKEERLE